MGRNRSMNLAGIIVQSWVTLSRPNRLPAVATLFGMLILTAPVMPLSVTVMVAAPTDPLPAGTTMSTHPVSVLPYWNVWTVSLSESLRRV